MFFTRSATRAFVVLVCFALVSAIFVLIYGTTFYTQDIPFGLYNALVLLSFSTLISESYFTKPNDVIANSTALLVLMVPLSADIAQHKPWFYVVCTMALVALVLAVASNSLFDPDAGGGSTRHKVSMAFKACATALGSGKALFGAAGLLLLLNERTISDPYFVAALIFIFLFLAVDVARLSDKIRRARKTKDRSGRIVGIQGDNLAIASSPWGRPAIGQPARLRIGEEVLQARVVSHHRLHDESRTTLAIRGPSSSDETDLRSGEYVLLERAADTAPPVGLVNAHSTVPTLKFRQLPDSNLETGVIVSCEIEGAPVYYQIQDARLVQDELSGEDATDYVEVTAEQIGRWNTDGRSFERYGWLPAIYSDVTRPTSFPSPTKQPGEIQIGTIPGTDAPVFLNAEEAVTHHTAILGVTGVGKSVFVRDLTLRLAGDTTKFICVDLTQEYKGKFSQVAGLLIPDERNRHISRMIGELANEQSKAKWDKTRDDDKIDATKKAIVDEFKQAISEFISDANRKIAILELGDLDGTIENLEYLRWFFRSIFLFLFLCSR